MDEKQAIEVAVDSSIKAITWDCLYNIIKEKAMNGITQADKASAICLMNIMDMTLLECNKIMRPKIRKMGIDA